MAVGFRIDYVKANGDLSNYVPDFIVKTTDGTVWIIETKGREEIDLPQKMKRLRPWCEDATAASRAEGGDVQDVLMQRSPGKGGSGPAYHFVYVDQAGFETHKLKLFAALPAAFINYQRD